MTIRQIKNEINRLDREIARLEMSLHHPNTLSGFTTILKKIAINKILRLDYEKMIAYPLQITYNKMKKKKVNKLKKAVTAKAKRVLKKKKK